MLNILVLLTSTFPKGVWIEIVRYTSVEFSNDTVAYPDAIKRSMLAVADGVWTLTPRSATLTGPRTGTMIDTVTLAIPAVSTTPLIWERRRI